MQYGVCMQMSEFTGKKFWGGQEMETSFLLGGVGEAPKDAHKGSSRKRVPPYEIPSLWDSILYFFLIEYGGMLRWC